LRHPNQWDAKSVTINQIFNEEKLIEQLIKLIEQFVVMRNYGIFNTKAHLIILLLIWIQNATCTRFPATQTCFAYSEVRRKTDVARGRRVVACLPPFPAFTFPTILLQIRWPAYEYKSERAPTERVSTSRAE